MNKVFLTKRTAQDDAEESQSNKKPGLSDAPQGKERPLHRHFQTSDLIGEPDESSQSAIKKVSSRPA